MRKLMVVDDAPDICILLKLFFEKNGFDVDTFGSADHVIDNTAVHELLNFDVILTDFEMPGTKGDQFAKYMRMIRQDSKIIIISAIAHRVPIDVLTFAQVVQKPFGMNSILNRVLDEPYILASRKVA